MGDVSGFDSRRRHFISVCNQPPKSTQPFILSRSINWVVSCNRMFASSHGRRHMVDAYGVKAWCGWLGWWCVLQLQHCAPEPLALANQLPLPVIVQRGWSRHRRISSTVEESDLYLYELCCWKQIILLSTTCLITTNICWDSKKPHQSS